MGYSLGLKVLTTCYGDPIAYDLALSAFKASYEEDPANLIQVIVNERNWIEEDENINELRAIEKQVSYYVNPEGDVASIAVHDMREYT